MLEDRGYDISNYKNYTEYEMKIMLSEHNRIKAETSVQPGPLDIFLTKQGATANSVDKIYVKYRLDERFKKTDNLINQIIEIYGGNNLGESEQTQLPQSSQSSQSSKLLDKHDCLIIMNVDGVIMKPGTKDRPDEEFSRQMYVSKGYFVQLFGLENFMFNVSRHYLVPKHTIMSKSEVDELLKKYNIESVKKLPTIKMDDAQAKYIGLRPKQVCRIEVTNITSGKGEKFRVCTF